MPKRLLIIYPHWPPSNLAGVHRSRLIANFLPEFDWKPTVLTVRSEFYEEPPDPDLCRTVAEHVKVHHANAFRVGNRFRLVGDIGLRSFFQLWRAALKLIKQERPDFIWIPIPSFYVALLGRLLHAKTGIPYGIDYIDPWVRPLHPSQNRLSRAGLSLLFAKILEPIAVRKASLVSGVSRPYYEPVLERNFRKRAVVDVAMPYGFDPNDHILEPNNLDLLWEDNTEAWVYAGAYLPKSALFFEHLFSAVKAMRNRGAWSENVRMYFVGTGHYRGKGISDFARQFDLQDIVVEQRERFPFLRVQRFLRNAARVLLIGSVDQHYTASKTFQCVLSKRPVLAILHHESTAANFLTDSNADEHLVRYMPAEDNAVLSQKIRNALGRFTNELCESAWNPDLRMLNKHSSRQSAELLAAGLTKAIKL